MKIPIAIKGRGSGSNPANRFHSQHSDTFDDGWGLEDQEVSDKPVTELYRDNSRSIINYNQSPDIPFDRSINPYRGCEHGCIYCYARPTHAYLDCSPGLDFETKIFYKENAAELLAKELAAKKYRCAPVALGINTDAYQPVERKLRITRDLLQVLSDCSHPVSIVTKSAMIERDFDLLVPMAEKNLLHVMVSVTTLDATLARTLEPRAATPRRRIKLIENLQHAGIPVGVLMAPVIPVLNDHEIETILKAVRQAGAQTAGYVMIRLPHEVKDLFSRLLKKSRKLTGFSRIHFSIHESG
ncbi:MAG: PA0069 family radical SAM protein [Gammaproteobacteria bacterium]